MKEQRTQEKRAKRYAIFNKYFSGGGPLVTPKAYLCAALFVLLVKRIPVALLVLLISWYPPSEDMFWPPYLVTLGATFPYIWYIFSSGMVIARRLGFKDSVKTGSSLGLFIIFCTPHPDILLLGEAFNPWYFLTESAVLLAFMLTPNRWATRGMSVAGEAAEQAVGEGVEQARALDAGNSKNPW